MGLKSAEISTILDSGKPWDQVSAKERKTLVAFVLSSKSCLTQKQALIDKYGHELVNLDTVPYIHFDGTLLHQVEDGETVKMLDRCLSEEERENYIFKVAFKSYTALHIACIEGRIEVVHALLSLAIDIDRFLFINELYGTALHTASTREIAELLVNKVSEEKRAKFILTVTNNGETALHNTYNSHVVEYLLSLETWVPVKSVPFDSIPAKSQLTDANETLPINRLFLMMIDHKYGNTALLSSINKRCAAAAEAILRYIVEKQLDLHWVLQYRNIAGKNAFDIAKERDDRDDSMQLTSMLKKYHPNSHDSQSDDSDNAENSTEISPSQSLLKDSYLTDEIARILTSKDCWDQLTAGEMSDINSFMIPTEHCLEQKKLILQKFGETLVTYSWIAPDFHGEKLLQQVRDKATAQLLVEQIKEVNLQDHLFHISHNTYTALHVACVNGRIEIAKYLLSLVDDMESYVFVNTRLSGTALHVAASREIAELLVNAVSESHHDRFLIAVNERRETALHSALAPDVVEYLLSQNAWVRITSVPSGIESPVAVGETVEVNRLMLMIEDEKGNTPLLHAINRGEVEIVETVLQCTEGSELGIRFALHHRNRAGQNAFHLACRHEHHSIKLTTVLCEYLCHVEISDVLKRDKFGNTPIYYASITNNRKLFACFLMGVPMVSRTALIRQYGINDIACKQISGTHRLTHMSEGDRNRNMFYLLLAGETIPDHFTVLYENTLNPDYWNNGDHPVTIMCDPMIHRIMLYGANLYPLTSLTSPDSADQKNHFQIEGCLIIDDHDLADDKSRRSVLASLMKLDNATTHKGKPKIVIRRKIANNVRIAPPGADFAIITVTERISNHSKPNWMVTPLPIDDLDAVVNKLRIENSVQNVNINSTCVMHITTTRQSSLMDPSTLNSTEHVLITGPHRGNALLICVKKDRDDWEEQYDYAKYILEVQLGLKVEVVFDLTAAEMISEVSKFANSADHGQMAALVVMSHGDERGNLAGVEEEATESSESELDDNICSVQALVDALCVKKLSHIPKIIWLSFCRGGIVPKYNRSLQGPDSKTIAGLLESTEFAPEKKTLSRDERRDVYKRHPFPEVEVPPDCYINYVTLPDSKSPRDNIVFREMKQYIRDLVHEAAKMEMPSSADSRKLSIQKHNSEAVPANVVSKAENCPQTDGVSDEVHGAGLDNSFTTMKTVVQRNYHKESDDRLSHAHGKPEETSRALVRLLDLLTDVAGMVREKSGGRITTNHCYSVNRHSKTVVIEFVPYSQINDENDAF